VSDPSNAPSRQPRWSFYRVAMVLFLLIWPGLLIWFGYSGWDTLKEWQQDGAAFDAYKERVRGWLDSLGPWAPLGFILIQALQVVVAPIPGEATGFLGGFLFGAAPGFLYSSLGLTLGSGLAFLISRWLGSRVVVKLFHSESLRKFDALFERNGALVSFLLFLFPGAPKDYLCYLLGLSKMPFKVFVALRLMGAAVKEVVERNYTHFITDVFESEPHSPLKFHTRILGFEVIGQHLYGELNCSLTRIILTLDILKAYQRLKTQRNCIAWSLTEGIRGPLESRLVRMPGD